MNGCEYNSYLIRCLVESSPSMLRWLINLSPLCNICFLLGFFSWCIRLSLVRNLREELFGSAIQDASYEVLLAQKLILFYRLKTNYPLQIEIKQIWQI